jgi:predicted Zn finger-like uncharacterized protein
MFKVECPGCKAPYQVDERRVPPAGLKMRCPKCGTSFQVDPPPADPRGTSPNPVLGAAPSADAPGASGGAPAAKPPLPKKKPAMKGTMIGVAPPLQRPPAPAPPPTPAVATAEPSEISFGDIDLPALGGGKPPRAEAPDELDLPAVGGKKPAQPMELSGDLDLPARPAAPALPRPGAKPQGPAAPPRAPAKPASADADLPSPAAAKRPPPAAPTKPASAAADLPSTVAPKRPPAAAPTKPASAAADLPSTAAPRRPPVAAPTRPGMADELDLPSPVPPAGSQDDSLDLPAVAQSDLPSPADRRASAASQRTAPPGLDLPVAARAHGAAGPADLPTAAEARRPAGGAGPTAAPARRAVPAAAAPEPTDELDLPSPSFGELDLPSPSLGTDLPSLSDGVALPAVAPRGGGFGEIDLPMVGADLPEPAASLPEPAAGLPVTGGPGLPRPIDDPFGGPLPGGDAADDFGAPHRPDPFGATMAGHGFGGPVSDPFALPGGGDAEPADDPFGGTLGDDFAAEAPDPFAAPPPAPPPHPADPGDEFAPPQHDPNEPLTRQAGGGTAYGEVNLDDGGTGSGVAIEGDVDPATAHGAEFSDLPSEGSVPAPAVARARAAAVTAPGGAVAEIQAKRRRRRLRIGVGVVVLGVLAGGALTLVPAVGPFGAYFIVDQVKRGDYERLLAGAADTAHRQLGADTYSDAGKAVAAVESAAASARRYKPLAAYGAFVGFLKTLRFGQETDVYAKAKVTLEELADASDLPNLELARATRAAADGQLARARQILETLRGQLPRDVDVAVARGEVELRARDASAAVSAWTAAAALEKSARTAFGLARAKSVAGDFAAASDLAEQAMKANPRHVGARILSAEVVWNTKHDEAKATKLLEEALASPADAGPDERIDAETLLGQIHLTRGRISQAEQAFGEAIKIADQIKSNARAARALAGLGEVLFRAGRYSQAVARFKAAAQADPDYVPAQVGLAKSSLELERVEEARDMLVKLRKNYPKDMHVAYWYGRVEDSLGDKKEAEAAYRDAIASGKDDPEAVDAYIALAGLLSQIGQADAANATLADAQKHLPASPALYKALGRVAMAQGRYADGLAAYQRGLELDPEDIEAKFLVGTALVRQHEFDKALETFEAVAKVDRDFPGLALERGILFQESGRTEEALREYEAALAKAPNDPDLMLKVGCGKAEAGNGAEADKLLHKVLEQRPNSAETHFCLGRALLATHDLSDAMKAFDRAVQIDPNHAEYYLYVGWAAIDAGNLVKAGTALKKALELDQGLADAYWQRGVLRLRQTRPKDAIDDLTKALELRPSRIEAHADLALAYYDLGKEDLALAEWQKAIAANPNEAEWRFHYGKLLNLHLANAAAAEQLDKAIELAEAANDTPPWLSEAHRLAALSLGNSPAAIPHWQAFMKNGAANSPYRAEAIAALKRLGAPWQDD